ncbi:hypothetical protein BH24CHL3_BH24CHL3_11280 [soil metagenome]
MAAMTDLVQRWIPKIWIAHAGYDLITGVWPVFGIESFQKVSGRKTDIWLVKTVTLLILVIGAVIASAGLRRRITPEIVALAIGSSVALTTIDVVYVSQRRISPVYLLDGLANLILIGGWVLAIRRKLFAAVS